MTEIGGYFELELPPSREGFLHDGCLPVNSGRHALECILRSLDGKIRHLWLPSYTCGAVLEPIRRLGISYDLYNVSPNLEIGSMPGLEEGDYIIVNNYFGIKDEYIASVANRYKDRLIIDNAQAWYAPEIPGIKAFWSPRKFFGVPDGGVAYIPSGESFSLESDLSYGRCSHLLKRIDSGAGSGYEDFHNSSATLKAEPAKHMSQLTYRILSSIDFGRIKDRRRSNYRILSDALDSSNRLDLPDVDSFECPMVYPYLVEDDDLRRILIGNKIFVATYWPNMFEWLNPDSVEYRMAKYIIPLPIDQRYGEPEMLRIINVINSDK